MLKVKGTPLDIVLDTVNGEDRTQTTGVILEVKGAGLERSHALTMKCVIVRRELPVTLKDKVATRLNITLWKHLHAIGHTTATDTSNTVGVDSWMDHITIELSNRWKC